MTFNRVFVNPGHGGPDPGALGRTLNEADTNMALALLLYDKPWQHRLLSRWYGTGVVWDKRHKSEALERICRDANDWDADLFVSIHCDSDDTHTARGWSIWTSPGQSTSDLVATSIYASVHAAFPDTKMRTDYADNDPDHEDKFYVLTHTNMPAVLIETAFISNAEDETLLGDPLFRNKMVSAVYEGIDNYK